MRIPKKIIKSNPSYAVVVDGETEIWYLQMLKRNERSLNINLEPKLPQKKSENGRNHTWHPIKCRNM